MSLAGLSTAAWKSWSVSSAMNWAEIATAVCGNVKFKKQKKAAVGWLVVCWTVQNSVHAWHSGLLRVQFKPLYSRQRLEYKTPKSSESIKRKMIAPVSEYYIYVYTYIYISLLYFNIIKSRDFSLLYRKKHYMLHLHVFTKFFPRLLPWIWRRWNSAFIAQCPKARCVPWQRGCGEVCPNLGRFSDFGCKLWGWGWYGGD